MFFLLVFEDINYTSLRRGDMVTSFVYFIKCICIILQHPGLSMSRYIVGERESGAEGWRDGGREWDISEGERAKERGRARHCEREGKAQS